MRRFGWIGAGVLVLGIVAVLAVGYTAIAQTSLLPGQEQTERAVEPTGAEEEPPKPVQEPEKEVTQQEETKQEEAKTDEPDEELSNEEQIEVADSFSAPKEPASTSASASASASNEASASASAAASAPADTTMTPDIPAPALPRAASCLRRERSGCFGRGRSVCARRHHHDARHPRHRPLRWRVRGNGRGFAHGGHGPPLGHRVPLDPWLQHLHRRPPSRLSRPRPRRPLPRPASAR